MSKIIILPETPLTDEQFDALVALFTDEEETCETCGGEKFTETLVGLTYDGAQTWRVDPCPKCNPDGISRRV